MNISLDHKNFGWPSLREPKTALLCEGGGQLAVYGVGALQCMHDHGITFPYYIGVSAAAANLASHLAGHRERTLRFYAEYAARREYMGFGRLLRTGSLVDLNYIYNTISGPDGEDPINFDVLCACHDEFRIVVTNAATGQAEYLNNTSFAQHNCKSLMASACLPIYCKPTEINGQLYFDGGVADSLPIEQALKDGCERIVAILNRPAGYQKAPERGQRLYPVLLRKYPVVAQALRERHIKYAQSLQALEQLAHEGRAIIIRPAKPLPMHMLTRKPRALIEQVCATGYQDTAHYLR